MSLHTQRKRFRCTYQQPTFPSTPWWYLLNASIHTPQPPMWTHQCTYCTTMLLNNERNGWCCNHGKYHQCLQPLQQLPTTILELCNNTNLKFSWLSRSINALYAFTAIGTTGEFINFSGLSNVAVTGRIYHRMLDLSTDSHSLHWFLYDEYARYTVGSQHHIPTTVIQTLSQVFNEVNPYIQTLLSATRNINFTTTPFTIELDLPTQGGDLAAIIHAANMTQIEQRKIVIFNLSDSAPQFIPILSNQYEPLQYPLLFPYGEPGWHSEMSTHSQCMYYRIRLLTEPRFRLMGRLTCEYVVDMYSRVEEERLNYLRAGRQQQLQHSLCGQDSEHGFQNMLPVSFLGSRAWASEQVADALALCREFGKPSLFLTMTTNPQWPEITQALQHHQTAAEVPEVVCRVFKARLQILL